MNPIHTAIGTLALIAGVAACSTTAAPAAVPAARVTVTAAPSPPAPTVTVTAAPPQVVINNNPPPPGQPVIIQPVTIPQPGVTDPWAVIAEYYGLIEDGQYQAAWNLQSPAFQGSESNYPVWAAGYADTGAQTLTEISETGDTVDVDLAAVDTATGVTQYFAGWFTVDGGLITSGSMTQTG